MKQKLAIIVVRRYHHSLYIYSSATRDFVTSINLPLTIGNILEGGVTLQKQVTSAPFQNIPNSRLK